MIIVTGGAGFIGSNIVAALEARGRDGGERVAVIDWLGSEAKWRNIAKRDLAALIPPEETFAYLDAHRDEITGIVHMGAISTTTETNADLIAATNFTLSQQLWHWCAQRQIPFIYASSAATYGDGRQGFVDNAEGAALAQLRPLNPYGWSKHIFDRWVAQQNARGIDGPPQVAGLKFFNVYGPNEYHKGGQRSVVEQVHVKAAAGEAFELFKSHHPDYADGGQLRDFVWVGDCVDVVLWLLANPAVSGLFNLGTGAARSFKDLATAVYTATGQPPKIEYQDMPTALQPQYQYFTQADMAKLRTAGYDAPFTTLEQGVTTYVTGYLAQPDRYV